MFNDVGVSLEGVFVLVKSVTCLIEVLMKKIEQDRRQYADSKISAKMIKKYPVEVPLLESAMARGM